MKLFFIINILHYLPQQETCSCVRSSLTAFSMVYEIKIADKKVKSNNFWHKNNTRPKF